MNSLFRINNLEIFCRFLALLNQKPPGLNTIVFSRMYCISTIINRLLLPEFKKKLLFLNTFFKPNFFNQNTKTMKKLVLMLTVIAGSVSFANAQVSVGVKAGLNLANLGGDVEDTDMRPSFHVGGYLNYALSEALSLQPELLFNSVGAKSSYDDPDFGSVDETIKLSYISIPVNLQYSFGVVNIHTGPQFSFLLSAKDEYEADGASDEVDIKDSMKGLDLGWGIGLGANFGKLNATARYTLGLSNIADSDDADIKNNVIQISLGYRLFGGE